jgi:hypothetical protein
MTYRHTKHQHGDYLDGDLSPDEMAQVEAHIKVCAECRDDLDRLKRLTASLRRIKAPDPGDDYFDDLLASAVARAEAIEKESAISTVRNAREPAAKRILQTLIRLAAAVTLLFTAFYISDFNQERKSTDWANDPTRGSYANIKSEALGPADYLPSGISTAGVPYSTDSSRTTVENSSETGK